MLRIRRDANAGLLWELVLAAGGTEALQTQKVKACVKAWEASCGQLRVS